jgi:hypothetical protein
MADPLKRGALGSPNDPSPLPAEFAGSLAAAIEAALNFYQTGEGKDAVPVDNTTETRDRRIMFLAIAKGVIDHLTAHPGAFRIVDHLDNPTNLHIEIDGV